MTHEQIEALAESVKQFAITALLADPDAVRFQSDTIEYPHCDDPDKVVRTILSHSVVIEIPA